MHSDFLSFPPNEDPEGTAIGAAKVTAAHEFKHAVQFATSAWSENGLWPELDATWVPNESWRLTYSATWLDPKYDSFENGEGVNGPEDLSGTRPPGIHELSMYASATYYFELFNLQSFIRGSYLYEDEVPVIENVPAEVATREVSVFDASFGMQWNNGLELIFWGRNLTDDEFLITAFPAVAQRGSFNGYPNQPRTYGVTLRAQF